ncbi:hypothetical protein ACXYMU_10115 [Pontibacter sp. CAU 1760]
MKNRTRSLTIPANAFSNAGGLASLKWIVLCLLMLSGMSCHQDQPGTAQVPVQSSPDTVVSAQDTALATTDEEVVDGIHVPTGLIADEGYLLVRNNCISCHSLDLVKNKRATREGWLSTIRWMQQTQGLWDLGENEAPIIEYLTRNYAPEDRGRRKQLKEVEWYILED